jgi:hypothetical protein
VSPLENYKMPPAFIGQMVVVMPERGGTQIAAVVTRAEDTSVMCNPISEGCMTFDSSVDPIYHVDHPNARNILELNPGVLFWDYTEGDRARSMFDPSASARQLAATVALAETLRARVASLEDKIAVLLTDARKKV